jgi:hypothetical protein
MSFQSEIQKTKAKRAGLPLNDHLTPVLFWLTSLIYFFNAVYQQWFTKAPEYGEVISTFGLGIMFLCLGFSFWPFQSKK